MAFALYSKDGRREANVLEFRRGRTYVVESELAEDGRFEERHEGRLVGPFKSTEHAERFITATPWFVGDQN